jgi:predicted amidohydrolase
MSLRLHIAQLEPTLGNLDENLARHIAAADEAARDGAQMLLFPELSLTGYFLKDQTPEVALTLEAAPLEALRQRSRELTIGVGLVERAADGRLYNAYALFEDGELLHVHRKVHLVTYGMFEEGRDFAAGEHFQVARSKHGRLGVMLCEDAWHASSAWLYHLAGVDLLVVPSAGPARGVQADHEGFGSVLTWRTLLAHAAGLHQCFVAYANRVGCEDGVTFAGHSRVLDPFGAELAALDSIEAGSVEADLDLAECERARLKTPLRRDEKPWLVLRELQRLEDEERGDDA